MHRYLCWGKEKKVRNVILVGRIVLYGCAKLKQFWSINCIIIPNVHHNKLYIIISIIQHTTKLIKDITITLNKLIRQLQINYLQNMQLKTRFLEDLVLLLKQCKSKVYIGGGYLPFTFEKYSGLFVLLFHIITNIYSKNLPVYIDT